MIDGEPQPSHDQLTEPTFSPDGRRVAYGVVRGDSMAICDDGVVGPFGYRVTGIVFSPDSRRLAYATYRAKGRAAVTVDGVDGPEFHDLWQGIAFDPTSAHVAYLAVRRRGGLLGRFATECVAVVDGRASEPFDEVASSPHYSSGGRLLFSARRGKHWSMVTDGIPGEPYDRVGPPKFGPTGRWWYVAEYMHRQSVVTERGDGPWAVSVDEIDGEVARTDRTGNHIAWVGRFDEGYRPVVDGTIGPSYSGVGLPWFTPDGAAHFPVVSGNEVSVVAAVRATS